MIHPIYTCEYDGSLTGEKQPTKILITEDNIKDLEEGDIVMWERFAEGYCNTMTMNEYIIDGYECDYITFSTPPIENWECYAFLYGAICYKIIK